MFVLGWCLPDACLCGAKSAESVIEFKKKVRLWLLRAATVLD